MSHEPPHADDASDQRPVTLPLIEDLYREGVLSEEATRRARAIYRSTVHSWKWFDRTLLGLGAALFLVGFGFLVAFNWHEIPKFGKLGLVQAGIVICLATAGLRGLDSNLGNAAVISGCALIGTYLAVFGQIYQTGADPWELFAGWAALVFGFACLARSQVLWMIWTLLVDFALLLFWGQVLSVSGAPLPLTLSLLSVLGLLNGAMLAAREYLWQTRRPDWLSYRWTRWMWAISTLICLSIGAAIFGLIVADPPGGTVADGAPVAALIATLLWAGAVATMYWYFRDSRFDLGVLALAGISVGGVAMTWAQGWIWKLDHRIWYSFLTGISGLLVSTGLVVWIRLIWREHGPANETTDAEATDE